MRAVSARISRSLRQPVTASGTARGRAHDRRDGSTPAAACRLRAAPGIPRPPVSRPLPPPRSALHQLVTGAGIEVEMINRFQLLDALQILVPDPPFAVFEPRQEFLVLPCHGRFLRPVP